MALSEKYIMDKLKEYAATAEGKKRIKEKYGVDYDEHIDNKYYKQVAQDMKNILAKHIVGQIASFDTNGIVVNDITVEDDATVVKISLTEAAVHRDSLNPKEYPRGVDNIVLLFAKGYKDGGKRETNGYVYGEWHNKRTRSLLRREPSDFLENAIEEFNSKYTGKAIAILEDEYIN